jgi:hypothetical protein
VAQFFSTAAKNMFSAKKIFWNETNTFPYKVKKNKLPKFSKMPAKPKFYSNFERIAHLLGKFLDYFQKCQKSTQGLPR